MDAAAGFAPTPAPGRALRGPVPAEPRRSLDVARGRARQPMHPGRFLERHFLKPLAITQTEAARRLGVSRRRINELVQGRRAMTPDTAIRCALAFGLPAADWLALQSQWDSFQAWKSLRSAPPAAR